MEMLNYINFGAEFSRSRKVIITWQSFIRLAPNSSSIHFSCYKMDLKRVNSEKKRKERKEESSKNNNSLGFSVKTLHEQPNFTDNKVKSGEW